MIASLNGKQRFRQALKKADLIARRQMRDFMAGKLEWLPCSGDLRDECVIAEMDRLIAIAFKREVRS